MYSRRLLPTPVYVVISAAHCRLRMSGAVAFAALPGNRALCMACVLTITRVVQRAPEFYTDANRSTRKGSDIFLALAYFGQEQISM